MQPKELNEQQAGMSMDSYRTMFEELTATDI